LKTEDLARNLEINRLSETKTASWRIAQRSQKPTVDCRQRAQRTQKNRSTGTEKVQTRQRQYKGRGIEHTEAYRLAVDNQKRRKRFNIESTEQC